MLSKDRLNSYIEAYKKICGLPNPYVTYGILNKLEGVAFKVRKNEFGKLFSESSLPALDAYLKQIMLRSNRSVINPQIMLWASDSTKNKLKIPYPKEWRNFLLQEGIISSEIGSTIAFLYAQIRAWGRFFLMFRHHLLMSLHSYENLNGNYTVFSSVFLGAIPINERANQHSTVIDWFAKGERIPKNSNIVIQTRTVKEVTSWDKKILSPYILPKLDWAGRLRYFAGAVRIFFLAFIFWMKGSWKAPYVASSALDICYVDQIKIIPRSFFFSNSDYAVRPFWSYEVEKNGSQVLLYFYSANINCFYEGQTEDAPPPPGYISMSWPRYLVIDEAQKRFLQKTCKSTGAIEVVGSIDFSDSDDILPEIPKRSLALFDVSPFKYEHVASLALIAPYYNSDILTQFLEDITECTKQLDINLVWKRKREIPDEVMSENYMRIVSNVQNDPHVVFVPPGIAARRLLPKVKASLSIPFTSTAILAKEMGIESAFYDPTGNLKYLSGLSRNLPVLGSKDILLHWLEGVFKND